MFKDRKVTEKASRENADRYVNILSWWKDDVLKELCKPYGILNLIHLLNFVYFMMYLITKYTQNWSTMERLSVKLQVELF